MTALTTLDGLANDTDIAIQQSGSTQIQRWKWRDGGLEKDGVRLDAWMFSGYLSKGRVYLADFSPPVVGEWFQAQGTRWKYLVTEVNSAGVAQTAQFQREEFYQFTERADLVDRFQRCPAPEWASPLVVNLTTRLWAEHKRVEATAEAMRNIYSVQENLRYITNYAERATTTLGRIT